MQSELPKVASTATSVGSLAAALVAAIFAAVLGTDCNSSANGTPGSASAACSDLVSALCDKINECNPVEIATEYGDVTSCKTRTSLSCANFDQLPGTSWTPDKVEACATAFRTAQCEEGLLEGFGSDACKSEPGSLPNGSPCGDSSQCAGGHCNKIATTDGGLTTSGPCGVCETGPSASTCGDAGPCITTQRCQYDPSVGYACVTPVPQGAACGPAIPCAAGLTCKDNVCAPRSVAGGPCTGSGDCVSSTSCIDMTCQTPTLVGPGETCDPPRSRCSGGSDCVLSTSDAGTTRTCVARAADGAPCDNSTGPRCTSPARCTDGICTIPDSTHCQ
jgi:hypothetical protein